jgi:hypothetical protein
MFFVFYSTTCLQQKNKTTMSVHADWATVLAHDAPSAFVATIVAATVDDFCNRDISPFYVWCEWLYAMNDPRSKQKHELSKSESMEVLLALLDPDFVYSVLRIWQETDDEAPNT